MCRGGGCVVFQGAHSGRALHAIAAPGRPHGDFCHLQTPSRYLYILHFPHHTSCVKCLHTWLC